MSKDIKSQYENLRRKFNGLFLLQGENSEFFIEGTLSFEYDSINCDYDIKLLIPKAYPDVLPTVWETGGKIADDFHKYPDKSLCLGAPLQLKLEFYKNPTLLGFVEKSVCSYLFSHAYSVAHPGSKMPYGEWAHGDEGIFEYYKKYFNTSDAAIILRLLRYLMVGKYRGHNPCPCGQEVKVRNCHGHLLLPIVNAKYDVRSDFIRICNALSEKKELNAVLEDKEMLFFIRKLSLK